MKKPPRRWSAVGSFLRDLRLRRGSTQKQLRRELLVLGIKVNESQICRWECGDRELTPEAIRGFSLVYHVSPAVIHDLHSLADAGLARPVGAPQEWLRQAKRDVDTGNYLSAATLYQSFLAATEAEKSAPGKRNSVRVSRASCLGRLGFSALAEYELRKAIDTFGDDSRAFTQAALALSIIHVQNDDVMHGLVWAQVANEAAETHSRGERIEAKTAMQLAECHAHFRGYEKAISVASRAREILLKHADPVEKLRLSINMSCYRVALGRLDHSLISLMRDAAHARQLGMKRLEAFALGNIGAILQRKGKFAEALVQLHRSNRLIAQLDTPIPALLFHNLYWKREIYCSQGAEAEASRIYRRLKELEPRVSPSLPERALFQNQQEEGVDQ